MNDSGDLILLAYSSIGTHHFEQSELVDLLTFARDFNSRNGLTGMLLYVDESFFQILEGDPKTLHDLYFRIEQDTRHTHVIKLIEIPIEKVVEGRKQLEGDTKTLHDLYFRIEQDARHTRVIKLLEIPIEKRTFSEWSMGFAKVTRADLATIPGLNDFFGRGSVFSDLEPGKAQVLLEAFRDGKWRRHLV